GPGGNWDCAHFGQAGSIAHAGDIISVGCGTYGNETVSTAPGVAPSIVFAAATPGCVTVGTATYSSAGTGGLEAEASYVRFENMHVNGSLVFGYQSCRSSTSISHPAAIGITANRFYITGAADFYVAGSSFGPLLTD